jgi:allantoin racemase
MIRVAFIIGDYPPAERKLREDAAKSFSSAEVEVGIVSVPPQPFGGLGPAEIQLVAPYYHAGYLQAEKEGYDAAVPLGTLDLGVDGGRSLVDIPIVGPCEAMFHVAAQLGDRFGIICYHESVIPRQITQTRYFGMEPWIAGRRASGFKLKDIGDNRDTMKKNFIAAGRSLIEEDGADVIIVHGITQCPVSMKPDMLTKEWGVPVVEGIGAPIRMAAMLVGLGLKHSRRRWPKSNARPTV